MLRAPDGVLLVARPVGSAFADADPAASADRAELCPPLAIAFSIGASWTSSSCRALSASRRISAHSLGSACPTSEARLAYCWPRAWMRACNRSCSARSLARDAWSNLRWSRSRSLRVSGWDLGLRAIRRAIALLLELSRFCVLVATAAEPTESDQASPRLSLMALGPNHERPRELAPKAKVPPASVPFASKERPSPRPAGWSD